MINSLQNIFFNDQYDQIFPECFFLMTVMVTSLHHIFLMITVIKSLQNIIVDDHYDQIGT